MAHKSLGALQLLIGIGGIAGGAGLVLDPTGGSLKLDSAWLTGSPFKDFLIPGLLLLTVNGIASTAAGVRSLRRLPFFAETGIVLGIFLMVWIVFQLHWIGLRSWLQPLYFVLGLLEMALALKARHPDAG